MASSSSIELLRILASRLEHLSADSRYAHRASGLRGSILKLLEGIEAGKISTKAMEHLIEQSFDILKEAALEIPDFEGLSNRRDA